jgi:microcin C transport system permease protein
MADRRGRLGARLGEVGRRRLRNFQANRRGYASLWIFLVLFVTTLFAELVANDKPLLVRFDGRFYVPVLRAYPETEFGGFFETEAEYRDPEVRSLIDGKGWMVWPPISDRTSGSRYSASVSKKPPNSVSG